MAATSTSDIVILGLGVVLAALYLFKDSIFPGNKASHIPAAPTKGLANGGGNPRDFIAKMKDSVSAGILSPDFQFYSQLTSRTCRKNGS